MRQLNFNIDDETRIKLKQLALDKDTSVTKLIKEAVNKVYFKTA